MNLLSVLPARCGHFLLESGCHTDLWLTLDAIFVDPEKIAPMIGALADRLRPHGVTGVCGPMLGGAFLAQALANILGTRFYYTELTRTSHDGELFKAEYRLSPDLRVRARDDRIAVVDDIISAGSSTRATIAALTAAGASVVAVGTLLVLGDAGMAHFAEQRIPVETLGHHPFNLWTPDGCPLCRDGIPIECP